MKQTDIYTEALTCLRSILLADHPEFQNWIDLAGEGYSGLDPAP